MFRHIARLVFRNFLRFKSVFLINLIGLSTGMACVMLIFLWVNDEWQTDRFHTHGDRLIQVLENHVDAGEVRTTESTAGLLAETMKKDFPDVEMAASVAPAEWFDHFTLVGEQDEKFKTNGQFAGEDYLQLFSWPMLLGTPQDALEEASGVVLSRELATRMYGSPEAAMGKTLEWQLLNFKNDAIVTGVFDKPDAPASDQFDFLISYEQFKKINSSILDWGNSGPHTFALLSEEADPEQFHERLRDYLEKIDPRLTYRDLIYRPYADGYLYGHYENGQVAGGRIQYVMLFSLVALFILVIACINFMNLSTAKAARRVKEVGIKKSVGASRRILILQYLTESVFMAVLSLVIAGALVSVLLPYFNQITGKALVLSLDPWVLAGFAGITLLTGLLAGSYPAFYLSGFNPALVLKGLMHNSGGELWARKGLVIFQFAMSCLLIIAVLIVGQQIRFIQEEHMGFDRENVILFPFEGEMAANPENFMQQLERQPGVKRAAYLEQTFVGNQSFTIGLTWPGKDPETQVPFQNFSASQGLVETLGLEIASGRNFYENAAADSNALLVNETAVKAMDMEDPVGKKVILWGEEREIVGVVKDFQYMSLHEPVKPAFIKLNSWITMNVAVRLDGSDVAGTINNLEEFYESYNPGYTFQHIFLDQEFQEMYTSELRVAQLSRYFAGLAILISCLGLFGLAAFTAERRSKEIGIRKILGAGSLRIMVMLTGEFSRMVLVAILIALPLGYFLSQWWLTNFTRQMELAWYYFAGAGAIALMISWIVVGFQTWRAARITPVESLRSE